MHTTSCPEARKYILRIIRSLGFLGLILTLFSCSKEEPAPEPPVYYGTIFPAGTVIGTSDKSILSTDDGGSILAGSISVNNQSPGGPFNIYVIKISSDGTIEWKKQFGTEISEKGNCMEKTGNGYLIVGTQSDSYSSFPYLLSMDQDGKENWSKSFIDIKKATGAYITAISDGNYLICGTTSESGHNRTFLLKVGSSGEEKWYKEYSLGNQDLTGINVQQTSDGTGFIVLSQQGVSYNSIVYQVDLEGNLVWTSNSFVASFFSFENVDDGYLLTGHDMETGACILMKINKTGNKIWSKNYLFGKYRGSVGRSIRKTADNNFIISGRTGYATYIYSPPYSFYADYGLLLAKINGVGDTLWSRSYYTGKPVVYGVSTDIANDAGWWICGVSGHSEDQIFWNPIYLLRTDSEGLPVNR